MFRNRISEQRKKAGLSQEKLAEMLDSGRSQVVKLERGERQLTLDWMQRIAKVLGCAPADLLPIEDVFRDPNEHQLVEIYRSLSGDDRQRFLAITNAFAGAKDGNGSLDGS